MTLLCHFALVFREKRFSLVYDSRMDANFIYQHFHMEARSVCLALHTYLLACDGEGEGDVDVDVGLTCLTIAIIRT